MSENPDVQSPTNPVFGTIEKKERIVAIVMQQWQPFPTQIEGGVDELFGLPFYERQDDTHIRVWKLYRSLSYIDDDWRKLYHAVEWLAARHGHEFHFDENVDYEDARNSLDVDGPTFNMFEGKAAALVRKHREWTDERSEPPAPKEKKEVTGYQRLMNKTWARFDNDATLKPVDRLTVVAILRFCWSKNHCTVWESDLAKAVGCDARTVQRSLAKLVKLGWIKVENHHRNKSTYRVLHHELIPPYQRKTK